MSDHLAMYVVSNGELAREASNAVVTLVSTGTFKTALKIGVLFSILGGIVNYMRNHDLAALGKWFAIYFGITVVMLYPINKPLVIYDISNTNKGYVVDHVPYGLAFPASIITSVSYGLVQAFEMAFRMPDDVQYHKTGMLFGSKLFRLSTEVQVEDPLVKAELNDYVKNCVLGDILIAKKYSMTELRESPDILGTITKNTSSIRGIFVEGKFKVCTEAAKDLKAHLTKEVNSNIFKQLARKLGWGSQKQTVSKTSESALESIYDFFNYSGLSKGALNIATQNLLINGMRDGILNYTAETGSTAALLNLSTSHALDKMRMTMATSRNMAVYTIPIIHTILLLLMLSIFPLIVLLALQPGLTGMVLKNYIYTLIWIESWPLMFACLNMVLTYYGKDLGAGGLTLSSVNSLVLEHSDIANMAGYLMLSIPFISGGLVKGMSSAFNHAASYIGGALQSSASAAASEAVSGNINLGNASWNNVNANKYDTNATLMRGKATEQLESGVLRSTMPDGATVHDTTPATSQLPVDVSISDALNSHLTTQLSRESAAANEKRISYDKQLSNTASKVASFGDALATRKSMGENFTDSERQQRAAEVHENHQIATDYAKREGVTVTEAHKRLIDMAIRGSGAAIGGIIGGVAGSVVPGLGTAAGAATGATVGSRLGEMVGGAISGGISQQSEQTTQHTAARDQNLTAQEGKRYAENLHRIREIGKTQTVDSAQSQENSFQTNISTDLRNLESISQQEAAHLTKSERLSDQIGLNKQHSSQIQASYKQPFANYVKETIGLERAEELFASKQTKHIKELNKHLHDFTSQQGIQDAILSNYQRDSADINPEARYRADAAKINKVADSGISQQHDMQKQKLDEDFSKRGSHFTQDKFDAKQREVQQSQQSIDKQLTESKEQRAQEYEKIKSRTEADISVGVEKARSSVFSLSKPLPEFKDED